MLVGCWVVVVVIVVVGVDVHNPIHSFIRPSPLDSLQWCTVIHWRSCWGW
jgi:hypothetical protein